MHNRRLAATIAAFAAGVALTPSLAFAAGSSQPTGATHLASSPSIAKAASPALQSFSSPAGNTVRVPSAAPTAPHAGTRSLVASTTPVATPTATPTVPNPNLAVSLDAKDTSAYGLSLTANVTSAPGTETVTVNWGDGTSGQPSTGTVSGTGNVALNHVYASLGTYPVNVTVTDLSGNTVSNMVKITTAGSDYVAYGPTRLLDSRDGSGTPKVGAWSTTRVQVTGANGIPAGVTAVVLNVTVTDTTSAGHVTAYGDGAQAPNTSNVNYVTGQTVPNMVVVPVGPDGYVDLDNDGAALDLVVDTTGYFVRSAAAGYTPVSPSRLVDTRYGTGAPQSPVGAEQSLTVQIAGAAGGQLPASGITAVALNVTVTNPNANGHLTVYPGGQQAPNASNLNFTTGQTVANSVVVPVGSDGTVRVLNAAWGTSDVIVDVVGYYSQGGKSAYLPVPPTRLLDTRDTTKWQLGPVGSWSYVPMPLSPANPDYTGFVLNATVTNTTSDGHLSVAPDPNTQAAYDNNTATPLSPPPVSSLNWTAGQTVPNLVQATAGNTGIVDFWNGANGSSDLIVDLFGIYQND
ncbi:MULTISPECIES: PKD domain-containing protein [unclassified Kitasatospora]|uniref:PKD domain-containing protein n=1 Tax=unclassified Kitasatospora TaxID=2633591 RepID=UPI002476C107|nr:PKD domain-containing protein [Kitasatospora sp. GAS204B]